MVGLPSVEEMMRRNAIAMAEDEAREKELRAFLAQGAPEQKKDPTLWQQAKAGLFDVSGAGIRGLGDLVGSKDTEEVGKTLSGWGHELAPEGPKGILGNIAYYGAGMAPMAAGAIGGGMLAPELLGAGATAAAINTARGIGAIAGSALPDYPVQYGGNLQQQESVNNGVVKDRGAAMLAAVPQTVLDSLLDVLVAAKIVKIGGAALKAGDKAGNIFTTIVKSGVQGAAVETPTEIGQQILQRLQAGQDIASPEALAEYAQVGESAALMGGVFGGIGGIGEHVNKVNDIKKLDKEAALKKALEEQLAAV